MTFAEGLERLGILPSVLLQERFAEFEDALYRANAVMNLTRVPKGEAFTRHFLDSLLGHDLMPKGTSVLDVGTGPGFPAWPLAAARPDLSVTALDSSGKMLGFLRSQPLPNLEIVEARAEEWGVRERFDVVTGRAVAPLAIQLELSAPPAKVGGRVIPMRSASERQQLGSWPALGLSLLEVQERELPGTEIVRLLPIYEKVSRTDRRYPRRWAEIKSAPLG